MWVFGQGTDIGAGLRSLSAFLVFELDHSAPLIEAGGSSFLLISNKWMDR